jgi:hypothetical protein
MYLINSTRCYEDARRSGCIGLTIPGLSKMWMSCPLQAPAALLQWKVPLVAIC